MLNLIVTKVNFWQINLVASYWHTYKHLGGARIGAARKKNYDGGRVVPDFPVYCHI